MTPPNVKEPADVTSMVPPVAPSETNRVLDVPPDSSINEPLLKLIEPPFPRFCVPLKARMPPFKFNEPVNTFTPVKFNVPASTLVRSPAPDKTPLNASDPPVTTSNVPPVEPSTTDFALNVPPVLVNINEPLLKNNEPAVPKFCVPANASVPAFKLILPENAVFAPVNVSMLAPACVNEPEPEITPPKVPLVVVLKVS
jgi:hypothetical protein